MRIFAGSIMSLVLVTATYSATHATTLVDQEQKRAVADRQAIPDRVVQCFTDPGDTAKNCLEEIKCTD